MTRTHGALALSLFFIASLVSCDITGQFICSLSSKGDAWPPWPCGPLCPTCLRECAPLPAKDFLGPYLVWYGDEPNESVCPPHAPTLIFRGHTGLHKLPWDGCHACSCTPGRCVLPEGISASATEDCEGLEHQPLDARDIWTEPINPGAMGPDACSSPEKVAHVPSSHPTAIFVPPPFITPCTPKMDIPPPPRIDISPWDYTGVVCAGAPRDDECSDASTTCVPIEDEYLQCIMYRGHRADPECPGPYPEKLVLYRGRKNTRTCTRCDCGPPEGGECVAQISTAWQEDCRMLSSSTTVTEGEPGCITRNPHMAIASLQADWLVDHPASCLVSGGERIGEYRPEGPQVLCCQTKPIPRKARRKDDDQDAGSGDP